MLFRFCTGVPLFVVGLIMSGLAGILNAESTEVAIPDANLRQAVREALFLAETDPLTVEKMAQLRVVTSTVTSIASLEGLSYAPNLEGLWLDKAELYSLQGIESNHRLAWLYAGGNNITDLSPLGGLTNLTDLSLYSNRNETTAQDLTDLTPLTNLTKLVRLHLGGNAIADLTPLAPLVNLEELYLESNSIRDIAPLTGLQKLRKLSLGANRIQSLPDLKDLAKLEWLWLADNRLVSLAPLDNADTPSLLPALQSLVISDNYLNLATGTSAATYLDRIEAAGVAVTNSGQLTLWSKAKPLVEGWSESAWMGTVFTTAFPWTYHLELGWLYCDPLTGPDAIWFYSAKPDHEGWYWTGEEGEVKFPTAYKTVDGVNLTFIADWRQEIQ